MISQLSNRNLKKRGLIVFWTLPLTKFFNNKSLVTKLSNKIISQLSNRNLKKSCLIVFWTLESDVF